MSKIIFGLHWHKITPQIGFLTDSSVFEAVFQKQKQLFGAQLSDWIKYAYERQRYLISLAPQ